LLDFALAALVAAAPPTLYRYEEALAAIKRFTRMSISSSSNSPPAADSDRRIRFFHRRSAGAAVRSA
jgi:hypothetical protein